MLTNRPAGAVWMMLNRSVPSTVRSRPGSTSSTLLPTTGAGHSEQILGQAVAGRRDKVLLATKFGYGIDEATRIVTRNDKQVVSRIRQECEASPRTIPIPGFKTVAQVQENLQAMDFGLLSKQQMQKIDQIFERAPVIPYHD